MKFLRSVYNEIKASPVGSGKPEHGGVLFSSDGGITITKFVYDNTGSSSGVTYSPNVKFVNQLIKNYSNKGLYFVGFVHSHPKGFTGLSMGRGSEIGYTASDEDAIYKLLNLMKGTKRLYFPVVQSSYYGAFSMRVFFGEKDLHGNINIYEDKCMRIVEDADKENIRNDIQNYLPIKKHSHATAIIVGAGSGINIAEQLVRMGISKYILIDGTRYSFSDISQFARYENIGGYKADDVARRIYSINPLAQIKIIRQRIEEDISANQFSDWLENVDRRRSLVVFCDDSSNNFKCMQILCADYRIALLRAYSQRTGFTIQVCAEMYDYWANKRAKATRNVNYLSYNIGLIHAINEILISKAKDFFTRGVSAKERREIAQPKSKSEGLVEKYEPLYSREEISNKKVVVIGCGGSLSYIENLVRSGIKNLTLIDGDTFSYTNIQTQMAYFNDIGRYKVDIATERATLINPDVNITPVAKMLDENMSDEEFAACIGEEWLDRPNDVLIAACTDNFIAQARCSKLALKYGFPYVQAGIYTGGKIIELLFFHPEVSAVCPRCILKSRYKANIENKTKPEPAKSNGTSIFFTEQLNSLKGFISLALLLYRSPTADKRYSEFMDDNGWKTAKRTRKVDRNFLFFTMDSKLAEHSGRKAYEKFDKWGQRMKSNYQLGVSIFRKQRPEKKCPDCGGKGKPLIHLKGHVEDTRKGLYGKEEL